MRISFTYEGKRYFVQGKTESACLERKAKKLYELREQTIKKSPSVWEWAETCIDTYKVKMQPKTKESYWYKTKHYVLEYIGDMKMVDVKAIDLQRVLNQQAGKSSKLITDVFQIIRFLWSHAEYDDIIPKDVSRYLVKPNGTYIGHRSITEEERKALYKSTQIIPNGDAFIFMLECGCRPAEAFGIEFRDFETIMGKHFLHIRGTKTANADRYVPCPEHLWRKYACKPQNERLSTFIFVNGQLHPYDNKSRYKRICARLYREMDIVLGSEQYRNRIVSSRLAPDFTPYCLRHTYCTDLALKGIDIRVAQKLMGHSDITLTANIYTHIDITKVSHLLNIEL